MIVSKDGNKKMTFKFLKFNHNKWLKIKTWTNHKLKLLKEPWIQTEQTTYTTHKPENTYLKFLTLLTPSVKKFEFNSFK